MDNSVLQFIARERVGVLGVQMSNGELHGAAVHYSHAENPLRLFVQTTRDTVKVQHLLDRSSHKASFVIWFKDDDCITLQMRGDVRIIADEAAYATHYQKHPKAQQYRDTDTVLLEFTPTWWRYTDFTTDPETVIEQ